MIKSLRFLFMILKSICLYDSLHVFSVEAELQYQARLWGSEEMAHRARHYALRACTQLEQLPVQ